MGSSAAPPAPMMATCRPSASPASSSSGRRARGPPISTRPTQYSRTSSQTRSELGADASGEYGGASREPDDGYAGRRAGRQADTQAGMQTRNRTSGSSSNNNSSRDSSRSSTRSGNRPTIRTSIARATKYTHLRGLHHDGSPPPMRSAYREKPRLPLVPLDTCNMLLGIVKYTWCLVHSSIAVELSVSFWNYSIELVL